MSRGQAEPPRAVEPPKDPRTAEMYRARVAELAAENAGLAVRYRDAAGERDAADAAVVQLTMERDRAIAEADRLRAALERLAINGGQETRAVAREALDGAS